MPYVTIELLFIDCYILQLCIYIFIMIYFYGLNIGKFPVPKENILHLIMLTDFVSEKFVNLHLFRVNLYF